MAIHDFTAERLFVEAPLAAGSQITATHEQANYLKNVLRLGDGSSILVFNGRDGEWRARLVVAGKRTLIIEAEEQVREQQGGPDLHYLFAPLKRSRLDYMVQKATEMGAARLSPVITRRTVAERVNVERMKANVVEAAEQCGILRVPEVDEPQKLATLLGTWDARRTLIFCDEGAERTSPAEALARIEPGPLAVLIGPEGGFAPEERDLILGQPFARAISLGPRIMRADTAAVAALALVNAVLGDWR
jgi:16S rRNA (uracil1498-N3)-methyltransferase